jgi:hypothetical protein
LDDADAFCRPELADGSRVHAVLGTVASPGTCISLRVPAQRSFSVEDCVASGSLTPGTAQLLSRMIEAKLAFLISGGTGSGRTTLLAALLALVPSEERIVIVEDSRELAPNHPHVVRIEGRPANTELTGAISLADLVRQSRAPSSSALTAVARWVRWPPAGTDARTLIMIMTSLGCAVLAAFLVVRRPAARSLHSRLAPPAAAAGIDVYGKGRTPPRRSWTILTKVACITRW